MRSRRPVPDDAPVAYHRGHAPPRGAREVPVETLLPDGWPRPKGYSNGLRVPAGRDLVIVAGMVGWDEGERMVSTTFAGQFEQALSNVLAVLACGGGRPEDLVRLTVYVTDLEAYRASLRELGQAWQRLVGRHYPCMALVQVKGLLEAGALVEIEATAAVAPRP
jgi:enamine deaminase RidA (YjgF/YER057c/UK114 family)